MDKVLLDTNVISHLCKAQTNDKLITFLNNLENSYLSVITIHELEYGLALLEQGKKREAIGKVISSLSDKYDGFILPINQAEAKCAARLRADIKQQGRVLHLADSLIAATAINYGLQLATRNIKDFNGLGLQLFNPFE